VRPLLSLLLAPCLTTVLAAQTGGRGVHPAHMDTTAAPCQDFFRYANGAWLRATAIPGDRATWGAFDEVEARNQAILKEILEEAAAGAAAAPPHSVPRQVGDFFRAGMDTKTLARLGLSPLRPELSRIEAVKDPSSLARQLARMRTLGLGGAFGFEVVVDDRNSAAYAAELSQAGLGLPDRDFYLKDDARSQDLRASYRNYLAALLERAGEKPLLARAHAAVAFDLELRLARASMTRVERRDPQACYNKRTLAELKAQAPGFDWEAFFREAGLQAPAQVLVRQPKFMEALGALAREVPAAQWRTYLRVRLLDAAAPLLDEAFERTRFAFHGTTLQGVKELSPRWKRVLEAEDRALGDGLGRMYVARAFPPRARARMQELVANLRAALRERIQGLDWMAPATREAALRKLDAFTVKIGHPDAWRDDSALRIEPADHFGNVTRAAAFAFRRDVAKLGGPVNRAEWAMTAPTVNAYYEPTLNEIVFPAGILQPPFFDPEADDAANYGAIGMIIGHEMTHGFDDQGCQYDGEGNLRDWWTEADRKAYADRTGLVVRQYDALEALPGLPLNGRLTLGENIADLGGLRIAFAAFRKSLHGRPRPAAIDGFTPEQRFFLAYAQSWHFLAREETARMLVTVDPHSPARIRVNAPLANLPEFFEAFGCREEGPMRRPEAVRPAIW